MKPCVRNEIRDVVLLVGEESFVLDFFVSGACPALGEKYQNKRKTHSFVHLF